MQLHIHLITIFSGKPVAVTHSKGQGQKTPPQGSDPEFEWQQWKKWKEQGGKKGKRWSLQQGQGQNLGTDSLEEEKDEETMATDVDGDQNLIDRPTAPSTETFYSMAEIASCSYEARQVPP